jgi:hypothetical protein
VTTFAVVSLYFFVLFAGGGMLAPFALAARARKPHLAVLALVIFAWVTVVLMYAAVTLA